MSDKPEVYEFGAESSRLKRSMGKKYKILRQKEITVTYDIIENINSDIIGCCSHKPVNKKVILHEGDTFYWKGGGGSQYSIEIVSEKTGRNKYLVEFSELGTLLLEEMPYDFSW